MINRMSMCARWSVMAWAMLVLLVLAGCKDDPAGVLPPVTGERLAASREAVEGFALVAAYPETSDEGVSLVLEFSQRLLPTQAFDRLLQVEDAKAEESSWTLDDDGLRLRYPFAQANRDYRITIAAALQNSDGQPLGQPRTVSVHSGQLPPSASFASQGSVLPARDSRGLPVVSVNVADIDVEFLRVRPSALPVFLRQYQRAGSRGGWELDSRYNGNKPLADLADPVFVTRFALETRANERAVSYLPIGQISQLREPGLYFALLKRSGSYAQEWETTFFSVTDIGLHVRAYGERLFVHTASLATGQPLADTQLRIVDAKGEPLLRARTDRHGNALLDYRLDAGHVLLASSGKDQSLLAFNQPALDLSEFAVAGRRNAWFDVFAWSGRDLYRPGETLRVSALLRDQDGKPLAGPDRAGQALFLSLKQPDGKVFRQARVEPGEQGYLQFEQAIPGDAPTGRWQLEFRTEPESREVIQAMSLRIEEFLPERMKLELDSPRATLAGDGTFPVSAQAAYLYGAPAGGNRFTGRLALSVARTPLEGQLPGYLFGDATVSLPAATNEDLIDVALPADGRWQASLPLPAEALAARTPILASFNASVHETGGRAVNRSISRVLWPAPQLVGIRPLFDLAEGADLNAKAGFALVRVDAQGRPQPLKGVQVSLVRELRDYHWTLQDGRWNYDFNRRYQNVQTRTVDLGSGPLTLDFALEWGQYRLEVRDPQTGLLTRLPFHVGWNWDDGNRGLDARPDKVKLALDKTSYRAGDTVQVQVTAPQRGHGLLLVETDRLLHVQPIEVKPDGRFQVPVTADWERHDVYLSALVFRGGSASSRVTPARALGVVHVPIDRSARKLAVQLQAPAQMQPGRALQVSVQAPALAGKRAHATLSAVDVGITNITRYPVPDPAAHFFAQRRFGIDAHDLYGRVIESFEGGMGKLRFGGDMALDALPQARRPTARVQTVDLFAGPVQLDAQGRATLRVEVPDFNGTLRVSSVVYGDDSYGQASAQTVVRAPLVAEASMPRVLAPGDRSEVTLDVQNFSGKAGSFRVRVDAEGPLRIEAGSRNVTLADGARQTLNFAVQALQGHELGRVRVRVDGAGVSVDRRYDLPVRAPWPQVLRTATAQLAPGQARRFDPALAEGLLPASVQARMQLSPVPPIPYASALQGLLDYPYGCVEQTTSRGWAALLLDADNARSLGMQGLDSGERAARLEGSFARLAALQNSSGHFSMWGGNDGSVPMLTPHVAEFLLRARQGGFAVPGHVLDKALQRLKEDLLGNSQQFYGQSHRDQLRIAYRAHAAYVLARVNQAPLGTLRTMYDNELKQAAGPLPAAYLGAALALQGDRTRGQAAMRQALDSSATRGIDLNDYGSAVRDRSLVLALALEHGLNGNSTLAMEVSRELQARAGDGRLWLSTQEQIALARLGERLVAGASERLSGQLLLAGESQAVSGERLFSRVFDGAQLASGISWQAGPAGRVYASYEVAGIPRQPPAFDERHVRVQRQYFNPDGSRWAGGALREGQLLLARVSITANRAMPEALLTELLPAGLELENLNLADPRQWADVRIDGVAVAERGEQASLRYEGFLDDRYVAALRLSAGSTARVYYLLRAVSPGSYQVPPPLVEDMYRPQLRGVGKAEPASLEVVQP